MWKVDSSGNPPPIVDYNHQNVFFLMKLPLGYIYIDLSGGKMGHT